MPENSKSADERRQFTRFDTSITVFFKDHDSKKSKEAYGITGNLSRGGLKIFENSRVKLGSLLDLELQMSDDPKPVSVRGEVVWASKTDKKTPQYCFGIHFVGLSAIDKFRILEHVYENWLEEKINKFSYNIVPA